MSVRIFNSQSTSAAPVVHFAAQDSHGLMTSVSAGFSGETTFFFEIIGRTGPHSAILVPSRSRYVVVTAAGSWGSAATAIDYSPNASAGVWVNLASVSGAFTSAYPVAVGDAMRFRNLVTSGSSSVDLFIS